MNDWTKTDIDGAGEGIEGFGAGINKGWRDVDGGGVGIGSTEKI